MAVSNIPFGESASGINFCECPTARNESRTQVWFWLKSGHCCGMAIEVSELKGMIGMVSHSPAQTPQEIP
jgi:hypothetical protein